MKRKKFNSLVPAYFSISAVFLFLVSITNAAEVCDWNIKTCPEDLNGQVIQVPLKVVSLSPNLLTCQVSHIIETIDTTNATPVIMFLIDNSSSMIQGMGGGGGQVGNDVGGTRFMVTADLLDSIYAVQPGAFIGLAVFAENLFFDQRTDPDILVALEGVQVDRAEQEYQAYVPPLKLDSTYTVNQNPMTGIEILRYFLQTETTNGVVNLTYTSPLSNQRGTNINNAFEAALQGNARVPLSIIPAEQRFIVFLSDGEPNSSGSDPYQFVEGTNTPTTFTAYLSATETTPPDRLVEMTENIRNNGYSSNNPQSDIWILQANYESLMSLFTNSIVKPITRVQAGYPNKVTVNNITSVQQADSLFRFNDHFSLKPDTTTFVMEITYRITDQANDSTFDSTSTTSFIIERVENPQPTTLGQAICWERDLQIYYGGNPVTAINASMKDLQVVFTDPSGHYSTVAVQVSNSGETDALDLNLTRNNDAFSKDFTRTVDNPVITDQILQHQLVDSIIVVFRNPMIPLDTIRKAYPFNSKSLQFTSASYFDNNADGHVDSIFIGMEGVITSADTSVLRGLIRLPADRQFTIGQISIVTGGLGLRVTEKSPLIRTYITPTDSIEISSLINTTSIIVGDKLPVQDKMAPVLMSGKLTSRGEQDSLQVKFSEPVKAVYSSEPIKFINKNGFVFQVTLEPGGTLSSDGTQYTSRVVSVENIIEFTDSIWINTVAKISDITGNEQLNPNNRRVPVEVEKVPYTIVPKVINNPFKPTDVIPEEIRNIMIKGGVVPPINGLVIVVEPTDTTKIKLDLRGNVSIYDVVKNPIIKNVPGVFDPVSKKFLFAWNGLNSNGRKVATGTYVGVINITDLNKNEKTSSIMYLGIRQ